jgi:hypothetical protein
MEKGLTLLRADEAYVISTDPKLTDADNRQLDGILDVVRRQAEAGYVYLVREGVEVRPRVKSELIRLGYMVNVTYDKNGIITSEINWRSL